MTHRTHYWTRSTLAALVCAAACGSALAIHPGKWQHTTEADFEPGQTENTVVTNLGDIKLAGNTKVIGEMPEQASIIYAIQVLPNGQTYMAAGPEAKLLRRDGDKIEEVLSLENEQVFTLGVHKGKLLVGVSGAKSRLATLQGKQLKTLVDLEGVRYVWDMVAHGKDLIVATGDEGKVLRVRPGQKPDQHVTLLDAAQANVLCLGVDAKGRVYAGTDTDGLIYRLTTKGKQTETFVLYDASEPEIGALLVQPDGTVFAGTADAKQARPGRLEKAVSAEEGRPEVTGKKPAAGTDLPNVPPKPQPKSGATAKPGGDKSAPAATSDNPAPAPPAKPAADAPAPKPAAPAKPAPPTAQQRDELRSEIRARLQQARDEGALQAGPATVVSSRPSSSSRATTSTGRPKSTKPTKQGNAIYRIAPTGFVTEVFRETVMILSIVDADGKLLVATGNEGQLFQVDPASEETTIIADLEPQQVPAVLQGPGGQVVLGTANPASLVSLDRGFAKTGSFTSAVLDATQISLWGKLHLTGRVPKNTKMTVQTRSGNVDDPDKAAWSDWSKPHVITHNPKTDELAPRQIDVLCPPARFLQYRVTLDGDGSATSAIERVEVAYVMPNIRPVVKSLKAAYAGKKTTSSSSGSSSSRSSSSRSASKDPAPQTKMNVQWEASDANKDALVYTLEYRSAHSNKWLPLAEDLTANRFEWETRRVPDGRYVLHVIASDAPDNTPDMAKTTTRQSDPIVIDNTPPALVDVQTQADNGGVIIKGVARDGLSPIRSIRYAVDSTDDWQPVLPDDLIFDSTSEAFTVKIADLAPGPHVVTLRAADDLDNPIYQAVQVEKK